MPLAIILSGEMQRWLMAMVIVVAVGFSQTSAQACLRAGPTNRTFAFDHRDLSDSDSIQNNSNPNYDANGNTLVDQGVARGDLYDAENRLVAWGGIQIGYDADGNRVSRTAGLTTTFYLVDDLNPSGYPQVLAEYGNLSNAPQATYSWGLNLISETNTSGTLLYYGYDGGGNVRVLLNGPVKRTWVSVVDTYDYDAYGKMLATTGSDANNYLFTGQQWDADLGMYYLRARYYNPNLGRFWTADTFQGDQEDPLSLHKYLYCQADPINHFDPRGQSLEDLMVTMQNIATMAAGTVLRAAPVINDVWLVIFQAATGETVTIAGGVAITGYAAMSRVEGGIGTWGKAISALKGVAFGPYGYIKSILRGSGGQAGHLNQSGAFPAIIKEAGACVELDGNAFRAGTEHNQFHWVLEQFWKQFQVGGANFNRPVSNAAYQQALGDALAAVKTSAGVPKYTQQQISSMVDFAKQEQRGYGYFDGPGGLTPVIPKSMNLKP
jgi:RHS repeat-associated protein